MCHGEGNESSARVLLHKRGSGLNYQKIATWRFPARSHNVLMKLFSRHQLFGDIRGDHKIHQQSIFQHILVIVTIHMKRCVLQWQWSLILPLFINVIVIQNYPHTISFLCKMRTQTSNTLFFPPVNVVCTVFVSEIMQRIYNKDVINI